LADLGFKPLPLTTRAILEVKPKPFVSSNYNESTKLKVYFTSTT